MKEVQIFDLCTLLDLCILNQEVIGLSVNDTDLEVFVHIVLFDIFLEFLNLHAASAGFGLDLFLNILFCGFDFLCLADLSNDDLALYSTECLAFPVLCQVILGLPLPASSRPASRRRRTGI